MLGELFDDAVLPLGPQACVLRGLALPRVEAILSALAEVEALAPPRQMVTPGGRLMSAALTNCGALGWTTDAQGYRYRPDDPQTGRPWPALPAVLLELGADAAAQAGFAGFVPDACLINHYPPGAGMSLHQDRNERDFSTPIVSISLGLPATFLFGGQNRSDRSAKVVLWHGDIVVWGGVDRMRFHGVMPVSDGLHPHIGRERINLTLRRAG